MNIIIKGMEMPKEESITIQILPSGAVYLEDKLVYEACAVEIPTPHGRLIDADKLMRDIEEYHLSDGKFQHWVDVQQTIIEAEGREVTE